jgi:hypothetical protein
MNYKECSVQMTRVPVYQLAPHQLEQLLAANREVDLARQRMTELVLLLVGPELINDPTLQLDVGAKQLTVMQEVDELKEE